MNADQPDQIRRHDGSSRFHLRLHRAADPGLNRRKFRLDSQRVMRAHGIWNGGRCLRVVFNGTDDPRNAFAVPAPDLRPTARDHDLNHGFQRGPPATVIG